MTILSGWDSTYIVQATASIRVGELVQEDFIEHVDRVDGGEWPSLAGERADHFCDPGLGLEVFPVLR